MCVQDHRAELPLESFQPCRETAGAQAPKHTLCNARAAGRAAGIRQTNPDFGDHSFITAITNTQAVTKLRNSTQTHRKWRQHKTWGARGRQGRLLEALTLSAHSRGRAETLRIWEAVGWQRGTGAAPAHHLHPSKGSPGHSELSGAQSRARNVGLHPQPTFCSPHLMQGSPPTQTVPLHSPPRAAGPSAPPAEPGPGAAARLHRPGSHRLPPAPLPPAGEPP